MEQSAGTLGWFVLTIFLFVGGLFSYLGISALLKRYFLGLPILCLGIIALLLSLPEAFGRIGYDVEISTDAFMPLIIILFSAAAFMYLLKGLIAVFRFGAIFQIKLCVGLWTMDRLSESIGFLMEILVFFFMVAFFIYYNTMEEQNCGCLLLIIIGFLIWVSWAIRSGFFEEARMHMRQLVDFF